MTKTKRIPAKRISRLLERHLRESERGKKAFRKSGDALDVVLKLGVQLDQPITLTDGREFLVRDQFANGNTAFSAKMFQRYQVVPVPAKHRKEAAAAAAITEQPGKEVAP